MQSFSQCLNVIPYSPCVCIKGLELLYQPEVVRLYLSLLTCSHNHNTLEAAAGALQNLAAGHWAVSGRHSCLCFYTGSVIVECVPSMTMVSSRLENVELNLNGCTNQSASFESTIVFYHLVHVNT